MLEWLEETSEAYRRLDEDYSERARDEFMRDF